jgi:nucleoside 2-deoxyribosyltransferase
MMTMRIYLAGPMRNYPEWNHPAFHEGARLLREAGHEVFSPAEQDIEMGFDPAGLTGDLGELDTAGFSLRAALGADLAWITGTADGIVVLPGWTVSPGARAEAATAFALSMPVWELAAFLADGPDAPVVTWQTLINAQMTA